MRTFWSYNRKRGSHLSFLLVIRSGSRSIWNSPTASRRMTPLGACWQPSLPTRFSPASLNGLIVYRALTANRTDG